MVAANPQNAFDVAIIGGGPAGSTLGTLLRKYDPEKRVVILEKERFPRDHIGESQLPAIAAVLQEMGVWEKIEAANFPVKIGATYTWGKTVEPWVFQFVPTDLVPADVPRPGKYEGWRVQTAFQVDRAIYDKVLLDHTRTMGVDVREETPVSEIMLDGDRVTGLRLASGEVITAKHYVDASGNAAILRRRMGVECDIPTALKNVAFWDYWECDDWAKESDVKATRVHIRSVPFGWLWFIRLSPTRTSIGLVCPGEYYKKSGKRPEQIYHEAVQAEKTIAAKVANAKSRGKVEGTTDWSFVVTRTAGENWWLVGETAGFADPILAAGLTITHAGGRELAYTILAADRGEHDVEWLKQRYHDLQTKRVRQHMKFAEYWYSANGIFEDIRENCVKIAHEAGMKLDPAEAFRWLSQGGLNDDFQGQAGIGGHDLASMKQVMMRMSDGELPWTIDNKTHFKLNLAGAKQGYIGILNNGKITKARSYTRGKATLAEAGFQGLIIEALKLSDEAPRILDHMKRRLAPHYPGQHLVVAMQHAFQVLEAMTNDYWVLVEGRQGKPAIRVSTPAEGAYIYSDAGKGHAAL